LWPWPAPRGNVGVGNTTAKNRPTPPIPFVIGSHYKKGCVFWCPARLVHNGDEGVARVPVEKLVGGPPKGPRLSVRNRRGAPAQMGDPRKRRPGGRPPPPKGEPQPAHIVRLGFCGGGQNGGRVWGGGAPRGQTGERAPPGGGGIPKGENSRPPRPRPSPVRLGRVGGGGGGPPVHVETAEAK